MHKYLVLLLALINGGCSNLPDEPWNDEYFQTTDMDGHHNLSCTNDEAKVIASAAIKREYREYYSEFLEKGFSLYSPTYGEYRGVETRYYTYKSILGYRKISHQRYGGSYYEKSIEVVLSEQCEVLGVDYFKGKIEYIE